MNEMMHKERAALERQLEAWMVAVFM